MPEQTDPHDRVPLIVVRSVKPVSEMSDAEYDAWVAAVANTVAARLHDPPAVPPRP